MIKLNVFNGFPRTFWIANMMELFERWAYYGMFAVLSVYLTDPISEGGLGFSHEQRGLMQGFVTGIIYLLPILGGAIADRFGFRKVLLAAFVTLTSGYYFMGQFNSYAMVFATFMMVAVGAALFKPIVVATVSKTTAKGQDTIGFGIFYMIVNIGGFLGPYVASRLRDHNWQWVFIMSSVVILLNFLLLLIYKEPGEKKIRNEDPIWKTIKQIFINMGEVLKNSKFALFLVIMVGFWTMYWQIFFTLPVYITQWIDTTDVFNSSSFIATAIGTKVDGIGIIRPEMMQNLAAFTIIFFQIIMSTLVMKVKPVVSMIVGILIVSVGMGQISMQTMGWFVIGGIIIIAFGEMISSPRIQEYIGRIAPKEKVALYMGFSYLPMAGGNFLGGYLSGTLYASLSDKYTFLKTEMVAKGHATFESIQDMDGGLLFDKGMQAFNMSESQLNNLLYANYHPGNIWLVFGGIGIFTMFLLMLYNKFVLK